VGAHPGCTQASNVGPGLSHQSVTRGTGAAGGQLDGRRDAWWAADDPVRPAVSNLLARVG